MNRFILPAMLVALLLAAVPAEATMLIDRSILVFRPGEPTRQDIVVINPDQEPLYVKVEILEVTNPGTAEEKRELVKDPEKISLLATPNKLMVEPGSRKVVRIVTLKPDAEQERVFRVNLSPVVGKLEADDDANVMAVKVVVGYQVLVLVSPAAPKDALEVKRDGTNVTFRNTGNTNILLFNGRQCPTPEAADTECVALSDHRLYPGNEWTQTLPFDQPFDYQLTILEKNQKRRFD